MESVQLSYEDFIKIPIWVHGLMGYNVLDLPQRLWVKWLMRIYRCSCISSHIVCVMFMVYRIYEGSSINSIHLIMRYCALSAYSLHCDTKFATTQRKAAIISLNRKLADLYPKSTKERINYKVNDFYWSRNLLILVSVYICSSGMVVVGPFFQSVFLYFYDGKEQFLYMHCYEYFSIDLKNKNINIYYLCIYILEWLHSTHLIISNVGTDLWLVCFQVQICIHLSYMGRSFEDYQATLERDISDRNFLAKLVQKHSYLIVLQQDLNAIFGSSLLLSLLSSGGVLCTVGVYVQMGGLNLESITYIFFITTSTMQLYLVCYYGELVSTLSTNIGHAAYNHNWSNASLSYKKSLITILLRSQQPIELSAMGYLSVTLDTFKQVMTVTYRVFALIREMIQ